MMELSGVISRQMEEKDWRGTVELINKKPMPLKNPLNKPPNQNN